MASELEWWWVKGRRGSPEWLLWGHVAHYNDFVVYSKMGECWKVSVESDRIWLMSGKRHSRSYAEKRRRWRKGKQIRSVNKLLQEVYLEMITAWAKAMTVCAHGEDVPFRALTKSTLESISRFWWRLFPMGYQGNQ